MNSQRKKVFVGMSGGVDSSVSAALLKEQGYDVTGVFIKVWQPEFLDCTWIDDRRDAMRVAAHLDIPFMTMDLEEEYKSHVVDYMITEYKAGRTPNPDVMCNKQIKFGAFMNKALEMGADFVATGHYARIEDGKFLKGKDGNKDQSYFLWTIPKEKLSKIIFPVGNLQKKEVRNLAEKFGLITAAKKDSQGLCFLGKLDMKDFLKNFIEPVEGDVLNEQGGAIGTHEGAFYYTIGQRHGFTITKKGVEDKPVFVISKDVDKNTITVSENPKGDHPVAKIYLENANWISEPIFGEPLQARARYRQTLKDCQIGKDESGYFAEFTEADIFPSGQSLVVYRNEECIGGGVIV